MSVTKRALFLSPVVSQGGFDCSGGGSYNRGEKDGFPSDVGTSLSKKGWWLLSVGAGFKSQENAKEVSIQGNGLQTHFLRCPLNKPITNQNKSLKNLQQTNKKPQEWEQTRVRNGKNQASAG